MNRLLALDTSAEHCSVSVSDNDRFLSKDFHIPRKHAREVLFHTEALLAEAGLSWDQLDGLVFGQGPGSFTGVRIGAAVAEGLSLGLDLPVYPVSCLTALAMKAAAEPGSLVLPCIDARMNEVYWCPHTVDDRHIPVPLAAESVLAPADVTLSGGPGYCIGSGWSVDGFNLSSGQLMYCPDYKSQYAGAEDMIRWVLTTRPEPCGAEQIAPVYLRDKVTWDQKPAVGS